MGIIGGADGPTAILVSSTFGWEIFLLLAAIVTAFVVQFFVAREFRRIAMMKGHAERRYFWLPFLLGLAGWILVAALPDRSIPHDDGICK